MTAGSRPPGRQGGVFANVPTWKEQGIDVVIPSYRMVIGPADMTGAQIAFWDQAFARLPKNADWRTELERNDWDNNFMNSIRTRAFVSEQAKSYRASLVELGLVNRRLSTEFRIRATYCHAHGLRHLTGKVGWESREFRTEFSRRLTALH